MSVSFASRKARGEVVGGGFIIFRRGRTKNRIKAPPTGLPFEHASLESAQSAAAALAAANPGNTFCIFQQVDARRVEAPVEPQP